MRIHERVNIMCENNNNKSNCCSSCVADILSVILLLQQNACPENCLETCDRPILGGGPNCLICNTRPVMLYTCCGNGTPWTMPTTRDDAVCDTEGITCSNVFRVEKLDGNCATFRVLAPNPDPTCISLYVATASFFTMDLNCCCAIRCLNDTYVECL